MSNDGLTASLPCQSSQPDGKSVRRHLSRYDDKDEVEDQFCTKELSLNLDGRLSSVEKSLCCGNLVGGHVGRPSSCFADCTSVEERVNRAMPAQDQPTHHIDYTCDSFHEDDKGPNSLQPFFY